MYHVGWYSSQTDSKISHIFEVENTGLIVAFCLGLLRGIIVLRRGGSEEAIPSDHPCSYTRGLSPIGAERYCSYLQYFSLTSHPFRRLLCQEIW